MKNKLKIKALYIIIFFLFFTSYSNGSESFVFDVTEIEITENGKKFIGKKSGTATTENGVTIFAENFIYDKVDNILYANTNVKIEDKIKNIIIYSDKVTYLKNKEIIFSENKSKAETDGLTIIAKSFTYKKKFKYFKRKR